MIRFEDSLPYLSTRHWESYRTFILLPPHHPRSLFSFWLPSNVRVDYVNERGNVFHIYLSKAMSTTDSFHHREEGKTHLERRQGKDSSTSTRIIRPSHLVVFSCRFPFVWRRLTSLPLFQGDRLIVKSLTTIFQSLSHVSVFVDLRTTKEGIYSSRTSSTLVCNRCLDGEKNSIYITDVITTELSSLPFTFLGFLAIYSLGFLWERFLHAFPEGKLRETTTKTLRTFLAHNCRHWIQ